MLVLREGVVTEVGPIAPEQQLLVDVPGRGPRAATADTALLGPCEVGDSVIVNTQAADLALKTGDNLLLVEVWNRGGWFHMTVRLTDSAGKPLQLTDAGRLEPAMDFEQYRHLFAGERRSER